VHLSDGGDANSLNAAACLHRTIEARTIERMGRRPEPGIADDAPIDSARAEYAALARDAAGGNRTAMEQLLMRAQEVAYRFSVLVCSHPEDAEDVMQDALLKTFQYVHRLSDPSAFRTWLYTTVRNACLMKRRRRAGEPATFVPLETESGDDVAPVDVADRTTPIDEQMMQAAVDARLRTALEQLPPAYRMIVVLRDMEGLSTREVATITGYTEANVKQRLHRARLMLRQHLEDA
jgi:RNA polymerase sigma-70 factor (ECF subfamily)